MRVAILHDYLNQYGGAERVLEALLEMFPSADLYTLLESGERTRGAFRGKVTATSFLDIPFVRRHHRAFIPLMPLASRLLSSPVHYDLVISSSAGYAKGFRINGSYHVSYCHSPLRYAWEYEYLKGLPFSPWPLRKVVLHPIANLLRRWDKKASERVNLFIANSRFTAKKIRGYYGRDAEVIYPPVDTDVFYPEPVPGGREYYLMVGRLIYYKRFDIGIGAMNSLRLPLKIVGRGPEAEKLKKLSRSPYIEFIPHASDDDVRLLYSNAKALIFPQIEDFGLVAAEALSCGTPVIAYGKGGGAEIVENRVTGLLVEEQTPAAFARAITEFEGMKWDREHIAHRAERFSKRSFVKNISKLLDSLGVAPSIPKP